MTAGPARLPRLAGLLLLGLAMIALTGAGLATHLAGARDEGSPARQALFVAFGAAASLVYFAACWLVLRRGPRGGPRGGPGGGLGGGPGGGPGRHAIWLVLATALAMRLMVLASPSFLSSDLFRYVWDGRVQIAGIDPYRYRPADPALAKLRDATIYPRIDRADYAHTIYPPMAQLIYRAISSVSQTETAERAAMLGFDLLAIGVMLRLLVLGGLDPARVLIYAWNPLSVWEFAGNGHIDAASIGLLALAMLARVRGRSAWCGIALGGAALVKFLPVVVAPALWRPRGAARRKLDWAMPAAMLAVIVGLYLYFTDGTMDVLGFLPGYAAEEGLGSGSGIYWLALADRLVRLPDAAGTVWLALGGIALVAFGAWMVFIRKPPPPGDPVAVGSDVALLGAATTAIVTPHYAWYFVWLALPSCLAPMPAVIFLSAAAILQYHDPYDDQVLQFSTIYLPFLALVAFAVLRRCIRRSAPVEAAVRSI